MVHPPHERGRLTAPPLSYSLAVRFLRPVRTLVRRHRPYQVADLEGTHWNNAHLLQDVENQYTDCKDGASYGEAFVWCGFDVMGRTGHRRALQFSLF